MVNPWHKYKSASKRKKTALHSLIAGLGFFSIIYIITRFFSITLCPIQNIFGKDCFGCGLSRGFVSILFFDFYSAIEYNVLSIPLFLGILAYAILCFSDILFERNDLERIEGVMMKKYMIAIYLIILCLSIYLNRVV